MNRRDVVEGLLLGAALGAAGLAPAASATTPEDDAGLRRIVVFDSRFTAARRFSLDAGQGACLLRDIRGDVTALWHELLGIPWEHHANAIHGMTTPRSFLCLQQLVAERFWRVRSLVPGPQLVTWVLAPAGRSA